MPQEKGDRAVTGHGDERLREEFARVRNIAGAGDTCPEESRIWDSAAERLPHGETEELLRHFATCGACAASWRLARELSTDEATVKPVDELAERRHVATSRPWWIGLAAAAMIVLVAGIFSLKQLRTVSPMEPVFRALPESNLMSETSSSALPREELVLRWSGAPEGTIYDLRVTSDRLQPLHRVFGLELSEYRVPAEPLSGVPPGGIILWSVTAHLPDGRRWTSLTFRATVE